MADETSTAVLHHPGGEYEMDIHAATEGASAFDICKLLSGTGMITLDPGFGNTAACSFGHHLHRRRRRHPALPRLPDRPAGRELHLPRDQLPADLRRAAEPSRAGRVHHQDQPAHAAARGPQAVLRRLPARRAPDAGAVQRGQRAVDLLPGQPRPVRPATPSSCRRSGCWPRCPTIAAYAYKKSIGQPFLYPDNSLGLVENFLRLTFGFPAEPYEVDPEVVTGAGHPADPARRPRAELLDVDGALVGSSQANLFACISAGINALFGPLHGGANQAVLEMLQRIRDVEEGNVDAFVERVKNQEHGRPADGLRAPGLQELRPARQDRQAERRRDPREARRRTTSCSTSPRRLEERALADDYFVERKLYPNVDFYTGVDLPGDGLPDEDVHRAVRARPAARLDRALARDDQRPDHEDRPPAPALHRRHGAPVRADGRALTAPAHRGDRQAVGARGRPPAVSVGAWAPLSSGSGATCGCATSRRSSPRPTPPSGRWRCSCSTPRCWGRPGRPGGPSSTAACAPWTPRWAGGCSSCAVTRPRSCPRVAAAVEAGTVHVAADFGPYGTRRDEAVGKRAGRRRPRAGAHRFALRRGARAGSARPTASRTRCSPRSAGPGRSTAGGTPRRPTPAR